MNSHGQIRNYELFMYADEFSKNFPILYSFVYEITDVFSIYMTYKEYMLNHYPNGSIVVLDNNNNIVDVPSLDGFEEYMSITFNDDADIHIDE